MMKFVKINPGRFLLGSPESETDRSNDETQHEVTLTKGFELGETPVTQEQWEEVMGNNPSYFKGKNRPVERVSWDDVQEFIAKLNAKNDGYKYRLPTEAEWEYACRAGTKTVYSFGDNPKKLDEHGFFYKNSDNQTHDVKTKKPNPWGLYDMHGNVYEWCSDWYGEYLAKDESDEE